MTNACRHGETQTHPNGSIYCPKCQRWASIDRQTALEVNWSVERITEALHATDHLVHIFPTPTYKQAASGQKCYGPKKQCLAKYERWAAALYTAMFVASEEKP